MTQPKPIDIVDLMPALDHKLITLLEELTPDEWEQPTIASQWRVKDVAVHLLDGNLRTLSMLRDQYYGEQPDNIHSYKDLVNYLNQLNADWVTATRRLSPRVIITLLKESGHEYCEFLKTLNPNEQAVFSVAWAGEDTSKNWFHIAREYTEKWHHQQQIRLAVGKDAELLKDIWYIPYLDTSVRALPHHYKDVKGTPGDLIKLVFEGATQKSWFLYFNKHWELYTSADLEPTCEIIIPDRYAWRVFTKGIDKNTAITHSRILGKQELGMKIFDMIAVMA